MNNNDIYILKTNIKDLINKKFIKLTTSDRDILCKYLFETCYLLSKHYYNNNFINQLLLNDCNDILSLLVLLLPYYDIRTSNLLLSLNEIFNNFNDNSRKLYKSTYYFDHDNINDVNKYFENSLKLIEETLKKSANKLLTNWLNIFPYTLDDYIDSDLYKNAELLFITHDLKKDNLLLGYETLYGVIVNFLYNDIKKIKWMIYDIVYNEETIPTIIYISEKIKIHNINNNIFEDDFYNSQEYLNSFKLWNNLTDDDLKKFKSLILFYSNYEKPNYNKDVKDCIKKNFNKLQENIEIENNNGMDGYEDIYIDDITCLKLIKENINFQDIYKYIFNCVQSFKYTWYGHICLDDNHDIHSIDKYFENSKLHEFYYISENENKKYYVTLKTIYNFFKALVNYNDGKIFKQYSNSYDWNELTKKAQNKIISKLNSNFSWFSTIRNIKNLYPDLDDETLYGFMDKIRDLFYNYTDVLVLGPIFESLVINGILTKFVYNPINTDIKLMPNKNKENNKWEKHLKDNLFKHDLDNDYINSFSFLNNKKLCYQKLVRDYNENSDIKMSCTKTIKNIKSNIKYSCIDTIKNSIWYKGFGGDWICQIQQYHHFIHNRVILTTGATGAGKSTIFPFIMLYAFKIINYNNNAKIICTAPRYKPVRENANRVAESLGMEIIENSINEIQYYTGKDKNTSDDFYHPTLRFVTDGSFIQSLIDHYILKIVYNENDNRSNNSSNKKISDENYIDMLLVDESHENNSYITMLLTLVKFSIYINNSITLGIISATMEYDEIIYRTFYNTIDDNYKYPLNLYNKNNNINRNLLDRRVHLSKPFEDTNFTIIKNPYNKNKTKIDILTEILDKSNTGDILIFEPGSQEVKKTINEINSSNIIPNNVMVVPYYSDMNRDLKDIIDNIDKEDVRKNFRIPKNYNIFNYCDSFFEIHDYELLPIGSYTRFIIVATNIVEASVTIKSLSYVIDTGEHKKNIYDVKTHKSTLKKSYIAIQNKIQRMGRIGRKKVGFYYQTYDDKNLSLVGNYSICNDNITNIIINLINIDKYKLFNNKKDPYKSKNISDFLIFPFIIKQYTYNNYINDTNSTESIFDYPKINTNNIVYPYNDGKYDYSQLIDEEFIFYIIHPNNMDLERDVYYKIIKKKNYKNRITDIFEYLKTFNILDNNNIINNTGYNVINLLKIFVSKDKENTKTIEMNDLFYFLHCNAFKKNDIKLFNYLVHNGIIKWIFENIRIIINLDKRIETNCDFIAKSKLIPSRYYDISMKEINYYYLKNNKEYLYEIINKNKIIDGVLKKNNKDIDTLVKENNIDRLVSILTTGYLNKINIPKDMKIFYSILLQEYNIMKIKLQYIFDNLIIYDLSSINFNTSIYGENKYTIYSYLLVNYYPDNLLEKLKGVDLYQNFYNKDINNLYKILTFTYPNGKKKILTQIKNEYLQLIFYLTIDDENNVQNLMYIPSKIFKYLNKPIIIECNKLLKENND